MDFFIIPSNYYNNIMMKSIFLIRFFSLLLKAIRFSPSPLSRCRFISEHIVLMSFVLRFSCFAICYQPNTKIVPVSKVDTARVINRPTIITVYTFFLILFATKPDYGCSIWSKYNFCPFIYTCNNAIPSIVAFSPHTIFNKFYQDFLGFFQCITADA